MIKRAGKDEVRDLAIMAIQMWTDHDLKDLEAEFRKLAMNSERDYCNMCYNILIFYATKFDFLRVDRRRARHTISF